VARTRRGRQDGFWCVHYVSHVKGEQPYALPGCAEQGRNAGWLALVSMGESWHNNHHAYPGSAQMGRGWRQPDPGWWAVRALAALGLVRDVKGLADLPLREGARRRPEPPRPARRHGGRKPRPPQRRGGPRYLPV
jgi:stearoyl-CoA desaturase (delta-9 desaturase)